MKMVNIALALIIIVLVAIGIVVELLNKNVELLHERVSRLEKQAAQSPTTFHIKIPADSTTTDVGGAGGSGFGPIKVDVIEDPHKR